MAENQQPGDNDIKINDGGETDTTLADSVSSEDEVSSKKSAPKKAVTKKRAPRKKSVAKEKPVSLTKTADMDQPAKMPDETASVTPVTERSKEVASPTDSDNKESAIPKAVSVEETSATKEKIKPVTASIGAINTMSSSTNQSNIEARTAPSGSNAQAANVSASKSSGPASGRQPPSAVNDGAMSYWPLAAIIAIVILAAYYYADRSEKRNPTTFSGSYKEYAEDFNDKFNPDDMKPITKPQAASVNTTNQPESSETDKAKSSAPKESTESDKDKSSNSSESDKEKSSTGKDSAESDSGKPAEKDTSVKDHPGFTGSYEDYRKEFGDSRKKSNDSTQNDRFDKSGVNNQHQSAAREDEASRNEYAALNQGPAGRFNTHAFGSSHAAPGADLNSNSQAGNNPTYSRPDQMTAMTAPKGYYYPPLSGQPRSGYVPRQPNYNYPGGFHAPGFNFQFRGAFHSN